MKRGTGLSETCSTLATVARQKAASPHPRVSSSEEFVSCRLTLDRESIPDSTFNYVPLVFT